jgi:flagellar protein FlbD
MISLTRLNGERFAINADLIERAEETPDTVITLTNGTKYLVAESLDELLRAIQVNKAGVLALAGRMTIDEDRPTDQRLRLLTPLRPRPTPVDLVDDRDPAEPVGDQDPAELDATAERSRPGDATAERSRDSDASARRTPEGDATGQRPTDDGGIATGPFDGASGDGSSRAAGSATSTRVASAAGPLVIEAAATDRPAPDDLAVPPDHHTHLLGGRWHR